MSDPGTTMSDQERHHCNDALKTIQDYFGWYFTGEFDGPVRLSDCEIEYNLRTLKISFRVDGNNVVCTCTDSYSEALAIGYLSYETPSAEIKSVKYELHFRTHDSIAINKTLGEVLRRMGYVQLMTE